MLSLTLGLLLLPSVAQGAPRPARRHYSRISKNPPAWLLAQVPAKRHQTSRTPSPTAAGRGDKLPFTGFDLLPELVVGGVLLAGGIAVRVVRP